ncbi:MAG: NTP transferase domain-containing protein [Clostridiales bacterium]|jgi:CTP:phosphocholine cytidylyltransferase-like protein|nr:NTP transferase domain-containing protein [Clostridiales bacterium]HOB37354.1 NTP transferase domain-containing protein [Candidatus Avimonas sp.]HQD38824.1 NTP transferase domain-containing protein [Candidatus Avimonas sp.]
MAYKVDNAVIMAAGISSRFAPLSYEKPKALIPVKGEVLIERQINQIKKAGIEQIIVVVGYMKEQFEYLRGKYGVILLENPKYQTRNNNSTIYAARDYLNNSYVCSADNYFSKSPFERVVDESYYAALFSPGYTKEWCMKEDKDGYITDVQIGGSNAWYMFGHTFWSEEFSRRFLEILLSEYDLPKTRPLYWEDILIAHLPELRMKIRKYADGEIYEFDTLDELRKFDSTYLNDSRSLILKDIASRLNCPEKDLTNFTPITDNNGRVAGVSFKSPKGHYKYFYSDKTLKEDKLCRKPAR